MSNPFKSELERRKAEEEQRKREEEERARRAREKAEEREKPRVAARAKAAAKYDAMVTRVLGQLAEVRFPFSKIHRSLPSLNWPHAGWEIIPVHQGPLITLKNGSYHYLETLVEVRLHFGWLNLPTGFDCSFGESAYQYSWSGYKARSCGLSELELVQTLMEICIE